MSDRQLTAKERITCAYMHLVRGMAQSELAAIYPVNVGRINEAIKAIEKAADNPQAVRKYKEKIKGMAIAANKKKRTKA